MVDRTRLAQKIAAGKFKEGGGEDTFAKLGKGEMALIAYVGFAYLGDMPTKLNPDTPIPQGIVFFDIISGPLKGCRHGEQLPLKEGDRSKRGTMLDAISMCSGTTFRLDLESLGTVVQTKAFEKSPVYEKMRWGFSPPPAGSPTKVEIEDPIWLPKVRPSVMPPEMYLEQYKLVCSLAPWWKDEFARSIHWKGSELQQLLEAEANPH
jgi:hypothetical protein